MKAHESAVVVVNAGSRSRVRLGKIRPGRARLATVLALCVGWALLSAAPVPAPPGLSELLRANYLAWTPAAGDTTPLGLLRLQGFDWEASVGQLTPLFDDAHAYAELRGVSDLPGGQQSVGVLRAALFTKNAAESLLVLNDDWCAAASCRARTRFVLLRAGQPALTLADTSLVPRILDRDLLPGPVPECLKGVTLGVQYLPSRYDTSMTVLATVPGPVRAACDAAGVELGLVTRPLRLNWSAAARKFVRGW